MWRRRVLAVMVATSGCVLPAARPPVTGVRPTGEPLSVIGDTSVHVTHHYEKTKAVDSGSWVYRPLIRSRPVWYVKQGETRIADEDFFTIAGDLDALAATHRHRARAISWNRRGKLAMLGGALAMVGGYFIPRTLPRASLIVGGMGAVAGGFAVAWWADRQMEPESHGVERGVADAAARRYNLTLGVSRAF